MVEGVGPVSAGRGVQSFENQALQRLESSESGAVGKLVRTFFSAGKQAAEGEFGRKTVSFTGDCLKIACAEVAKASIKTDLSDVAASLNGKLNDVAEQRFGQMGRSGDRTEAVVKLGLARALVAAWQKEPKCRPRLKALASDLANLGEEQ